MLPPGCEERCPGCGHRELSAEESEAAKLRWLSRSLSKWAEAIEPIRAPSQERRWHYRDRALLHATRGSMGWEFGLRRPSRGRDQKDEIVPIPRCPVHTERVRRALSLLSEGLRTKSILEMDLRFVVVAGSLLSLVVKTRPESEFAGSGELETAIEKLSERLAQAGITGVFANFNPVAGKRVFFNHGWRHLWGETCGADTGAGIQHGPQSFQQLIPELFGNALACSAEWLLIGNGDFVLDLYSGLGSSMQKWRQLGCETIGVELAGQLTGMSPEVVLRGRVAERIPQIEKYLSAWRERCSGGALTVFANPPRTGLEPGVAEWLGGPSVRPSRIAYLSCSAGTLCRDLSKLVDCAYRVERIIPYDFFPQTAHVETLALLVLDPVDGVPAPVACERLRRAQ